MITFSAIGLLYAAAAAGLLIRAFGLPASPLQAANNASNDDEFILRLNRQRFDARLAFPLLFAGFALQFLGAVNFAEIPTLQFMFVAALLVVLLYYGLMRDLIALQSTEALVSGSARPAPKLLVHAGEDMLPPRRVMQASAGA